MSRYVRRFRVAGALKERYGVEVSQHRLDQRLKVIGEAAPWLSSKQGLGYGQGVSRMYSEGALVALAEVSARAEAVRDGGKMADAGAEEFALLSVAADLRRFPEARWPVEDPVVDALRATLEHNRAHTSSLDIAVERVKEGLQHLRVRFAVDTAETEAALERAVGRAAQPRSSADLALSSV